MEDLIKKIKKINETQTRALRKLLSSQTQEEINVSEEILDNLKYLICNFNKKLIGVKVFLSCIQYFHQQKLEKQFFDGLDEKLSEIFALCVKKCIGFDETENILVTLSTLISKYINQSDLFGIQTQNLILSQLIQTLIEENLSFNTKYNLLSTVCQILKLPSVQKINCKNDIILFSNWLLTCGDFELQSDILEALLYLFNSISKTDINIYCAKWFSRNSHIKKLFLETDFTDFESESRKFLNFINKSISNPKVFSLGCICVMKDGCELKKPDDRNYSDFWVDFNLYSERVLIYFQETLDCWDILRLNNSYILHVTSEYDEFNDNSNENVSSIKLSFYLSSEISSVLVDIWFAFCDDFQFLENKFLIPVYCYKYESNWKNKENICSSRYLNSSVVLPTPNGCKKKKIKTYKCNQFMSTKVEKCKKKVSSNENISIINKSNSEGSMLKNINNPELHSGTDTCKRKKLFNDQDNIEGVHLSSINFLCDQEHSGFTQTLLEAEKEERKSARPKVSYSYRNQSLKTERLEKNENISDGDEGSMITNSLQAKSSLGNKSNTTFYIQNYGKSVYSDISTTPESLKIKQIKEKRKRAIRKPHVKTRLNLHIEPNIDNSISGVQNEISTKTCRNITSMVELHHTNRIDPLRIKETIHNVEVQVDCALPEPILKQKNLIQNYFDCLEEKGCLEYNSQDFLTNSLTTINLMEEDITRENKFPLYENNSPKNTQNVYHSSNSYQFSHQNQQKMLKEILDKFKGSFSKKIEERVMELKNKLKTVMQEKIGETIANIYNELQLCVSQTVDKAMSNYKFINDDLITELSKDLECYKGNIILIDILNKFKYNFSKSSDAKEIELKNELKTSMEGKVKETITKLSNELQSCVLRTVDTEMSKYKVENDILVIELIEDFKCEKKEPVFEEILDKFKENFVKNVEKTKMELINHLKTAMQQKVKKTTTRISNELRVYISGIIDEAMSKYKFEKDSMVTGLLKDLEYDISHMLKCDNII
uniref:Synaptonemal complex protein 2 Spt16M-like domain-containing protein n=1 Tax=Clastoptera arizonana TaxID=38151 RepID=A0A1B6EDC4_9HEMI